MKDFLNLDVYKNRLREYYNSGEYFSEIQDKITEAAQYLNQYIGQPNICICLDIDETMVTEWQLMQKYDFGWFPLAFKEADITENFPAIPPVLEFYNGCILNYVPVFIVTAKRQKYSTYAIKMLSNARYKGWENIYFMADDDEETIENYKIKTRDYIRSLGYKIVLNIGDQMTDLSDTQAHNILIPNPFYRITSEM